MDWLLARQDSIEATLAGRHLSEGGMAMFDLSSSWMEGSHCPLAARGYSRDRKKGKLQIEYGLLTDPDGRPVAIRVFAGNTADPTAFTEAVEVVRGKFGLGQLTLVGDRGMITSARIEALRELGGLSWITCLRAPTIAKLADQNGPLQMSLFDQQDLAEISHLDYPGEQLVACRNPLQAAHRARTRADLLAATEALLVPIITAVEQGRLAGADAIGIKVGKLIDRYKMAKHFDVAITDTSLTLTRRASQIPAEAALDGIYVIRTSVPAAKLDAPATVIAYKNPRPPRAGPPLDQSRRPGPAPDPPLPARPGPRPRADLHAGLLPRLAPAHRAGRTDLHRRTPPNPGQPRRPRHPIRHRQQQSRPSHRHPRPTAAQLPWPARTHGHPDP
jgi:hypothetical protein